MKLPLLLWILLTPYLILAQSYTDIQPNEMGLPFIKNYLPIDYEGLDQNWSIVQDKNGFIYVGNEIGILQYDGNDWRNIELSNYSVARSLSIDSHGHIYAGGDGELGYLAPDSLGHMAYVSLREHLPEQKRNFADVLDIFPTTHGIYFRTNRYIIRWKEPISNESNGEMNLWELDRRFELWKFEDQIYVQQQGSALLKIESDSIIPVNDTEEKADFGKYSLYDLSGLSPDLQAYLQKSQIYKVKNLPNGYTAISTLYGGGLILDKQRKWVRSLNQSLGLTSDIIYAIYPDQQENLWLGTENGISHVEIHAPITYYTDKQGYKGSAQSIIRHQGILYLATSNGIFYLEAASSPKVLPSFKPITQQDNAWSFAVVDKELLVGSRKGVSIIKQKRSIPLPTSIPTTFFLYPSPTHSNLLYLGLENGLGLLKKESGQWHYAGRFLGINQQIRSIVEDESGSLWLGSIGDGVYKVSFPKNSSEKIKNWKVSDPSISQIAINVQGFGQEAGLPPGFINVCSIDKKTVFTTANGLKRFEPSNQSFVREDSFGPLLGETRCLVYRIEKGKNGKILSLIDKDITDDNGRAEIATSYLQDNGSYQVEFNQLNRIPSSYIYGLQFIYPDPVYPDIAWLGGRDGLIRYDASLDGPYQTDFPAYVRAAKINGDSLIYYGASVQHQDSWTSPILTYVDNSLRFEYASPAFQGASENVFQVFLEGFDKGWSEWTKETKKDYTNLPEGDYTFKVKARNVYHKISKEGVFTFTITPPWYRSWWAYLLYLILGVFVILIFAQWRTLETRKKLIAQQKLTQRLQRIDELKDQFLANTSHELRTPLNGIIGLAESLQDGVAGPLPSKAINNLDLIVASGKRLNNLVNDILDFSKLKNQDLKLKKRPIDLYAIVDVVLKLSKPSVGEKDLQLINAIPPTLPQVLADENRLEQILYNLIGNAIKFTDKGEINVFAKVHNSKNGEHLIISVRDTGIGIPSEKFENIFESFEQIEGSTSREYSGTGLGLTVSKQLVELHGGKIWLESEVDQGSSFFFSLPTTITPIPEADLTEGSLNKEDSPHVPIAPILIQSPTLPKENITDKTNQQAPVNILIVDDEPVNRQVLYNHLSLEGYHIVQATDGLHALEILKDTPRFDLIILDIMMPRMSGYEVCEKLRDLYPPSELPILMLTAKDRTVDLVQGLETGANDYLTKPFSKDELLTRIKTHLNLHRIHQATSRFVPIPFLHAIGRDTITDVQLGDHQQKNVTVFFSDIRSYTSLAEQMEPHEAFQFVNSYAGKMGPIIQHHRGFVHQYLGDAIMALFQHSPKDALEAAIAMQKSIRIYNLQRVSKQRPSIKVGMGMHTGKLIMGIIGDLKRTDPATISDTVNTASRIEGLTKYFGSSILLSETSLQHIQKDYTSSEPDFLSSLRYLGKVQVKGRQKAIGIYECLEGEDPLIKAEKIRTLKIFEEGMQAYLQKEFVHAEEAFTQVLSMYSADEAAKWFLQKAQHYAQYGVAKNWSGIESMERK